MELTENWENAVVSVTKAEEVCGEEAISMSCYVRVVKKWMKLAL